MSHFIWCLLSTVCSQYGEDYSNHALTDPSQPLMRSHEGPLVGLYSSSFPPLPSLQLFMLCDSQRSWAAAPLLDVLG